jgi:hypothetical protein
MRNTFSLVLLSSFLAAGCHSSSHGGHYQPPPPTPPSQLLPFAIDPGAPTLIDATHPGYGITANVGGAYRIVWSGNGGGYNHFYGYVYSASGFGSVDPGCVGNTCPLESDDYMAVANYSGGGQYIEFDTYASSGFDGVDFTTPADPVEFDLYIDGAQYPTAVYFTSNGQPSNTDVFPFTLAINE